MGKKHIMQLPTNVPRLKEGTGLFGGKVYDERKAPNVGKKGTKLFGDEFRDQAKNMPSKIIKPEKESSGRVYGINKRQYLKDRSDYIKKQGSLLNKEFWDLLRLGKPKLKDYGKPMPKPKKEIAI